MAGSDNLPLGDILAHTAWMRRLAQRLVADAAERDEVVQQVWMQALLHAPRTQNLRPWLTVVLRNVARMQLRGSGRRRQREHDAEAAPAPATPEELVDRVEVEREVASALLEVAEPYRATLLLRYYEDLSSAEIARRLAIPAATVRSRLKRGLDELRARLDARAGGDRRRWSVALVPTAIAARGAGGSAALLLGGIVVIKATKLCVALVGIALILWLGTRLLHERRQPGEVARAPAGAAWRMPGGFGARGTAPPTVAGVTLPAWFGQRGAPVRRIAGRVTFAGAPLAGATVELGSVLSDAGILSAALRRTGEDGRFDFGMQPPARYTVAASAPGHSPVVQTLDARDPTTPSDRLELSLGGCESALFGQINDASGGIIAGARLCFAPSRAAACTSSDEHGRYELCVGSQLFSVAVSAKGYGAIQHDIFNGGRRVRQDFALTPEAIIVGRVVRADNGSAVVGATVRTEPGEIGRRRAAPAVVVTDAQGHFSLPGLAPGRHRLIAFAQGLATGEAVDVNLEAGRTTPEIVLRLQSAASVRGVVVDGSDPVAGATVSLAGLGPIPGSNAVTQSDGSFVLDSVPRGTVLFRVWPYEVIEPKSLLVDRPALDGVRIVVSALGSIAGLVTRSGKPVAGMGIISNGNGPLTFTEADGTYVLRALTAQRYQITAQDHRVGGTTTPEIITLGKGEHRQGADIDLNYAGGISGVVVEADGTPAAGVQVHFGALHRYDVGEDVTAPDGSFSVGTLGGGDDYQAIVRPTADSATHLVPAEGAFPTVRVADGASQVTGVRLVIKRDHLSIAGLTVDGDGQPLSDVRVTAFRSDGDEPPTFNGWLDHPSAISAGDGSFEIDGLDAGSFVLEARGGDGSEATLRDVPAGPKGVVIKLAASGGIDGQLVGFATPPEVTARPDKPFSPTLRVFAVVDGSSFRLRGLAPGSYLVAAAGGGGAEQMVQVQSGQTAMVTLRNQGAATVRGRVIDWRSGIGVAGVHCYAMYGSPSGTRSPVSQDISLSDSAGAFTLDGVPAGQVTIFCVGAMPFYSGGLAQVTLSDGQTATCEVNVVQTHGTALAEVGADLGSDGQLVAHVIRVYPHGAADRGGVKAGDSIVTVDGSAVGKLSAQGIQFAIGDRALGSHAVLGLMRSGGAVTAELVLTAPLEY